MGTALNDSICFIFQELQRSDAGGNHIINLEWNHSLLLSQRLKKEGCNEGDHAFEWLGVHQFTNGFIIHLRHLFLGAVQRGIFQLPSDLEVADCQISRELSRSDQHDHSQVKISV